MVLFSSGFQDRVCTCIEVLARFSVVRVRSRACVPGTAVSEVLGPPTRFVFSFFSCFVIPLRERDCCAWRGLRSSSTGREATGSDVQSRGAAEDAL